MKACTLQIIICVCFHSHCCQPKMNSIFELIVMFLYSLLLLKLISNTHFTFIQDQIRISIIIIIIIEQHFTLFHYTTILIRIYRYVNISVKITINLFSPIQIISYNLLLPSRIPLASRKLEKMFQLPPELMNIEVCSCIFYVLYKTTIMSQILHLSVV